MQLYISTFYISLNLIFSKTNNAKINYFLYFLIIIIIFNILKSNITNEECMNISHT